MAFVSREDRLASVYRKVEALYRQGYETEEIARMCGIPKIDALDIVQSIFARDEMKKERQRRA